ncbi:MAG TPA: branched-chain amino acid ABC transporter permease [Acidimicrobiia bacterium]
MTEATAPARRTRRASRITPVATFLWFLRIVALVVILYGSFQSISSGRLNAAQWRDLIVFGVSTGSVYALIALGYTMVYGVLRFINFAHGEVFMTGAMSAFLVANGLATTSLWASNPVLSLLIVLLASMVTSTAVAVIVERVAYRPLRGAPRLIPLITSIGASFTLQYIVRGLVGPSTRAFPRVEQLRGTWNIFGLVVLKSQIVVIVAALLMMAGLYLFVERTRTGRSMRAVSEDPETAALMGINVDRTIVTVFAVGGAMAGVAGALWGLVFPSLNFFSGFLPGIKAFTAAVLGGIGNIVGAMLGGVSVGLFESVGPSLVLAGYEIPAFSQLKDVVAYLALVLVLIFRPSGILGERLATERT